MKFYRLDETITDRIVFALLGRPSGQTVWTLKYSKVLKEAQDKMRIKKLDRERKIPKQTKTKLKFKYEG